MSTVEKALEGIEPEYQTILGPKCVPGLDKILGTIFAGPTFVPAPNDIFRAFRLCPYAGLHTIIIGQDPYHTTGAANGLSFSTHRGISIQPSLKMIYKALIHAKLMKNMPSHGDLEPWARQGILMLNLALTTLLGKAAAHISLWEPYMRSIICELMKAMLTAKREINLVLWGAYAHKLELIVMAAIAKCPNKDMLHILKWGHPSPLNFMNKSLSDKGNFLYCDHFTQINANLQKQGRPIVDWNIVDDVAPVNGGATLVYLGGGASQVTGNSFTLIAADGSFSKKKGAWGYVVFNTVVGPENTHFAEYIDKIKLGGKGSLGPKKRPEIAKPYIIAQGAGLVEGKQTNNRGELTAILEALKYVAANKAALENKPIIILSDSQYSLMSITIWGKKWREEGDKDKKNLDIVYEIMDLRAELEKWAKIVYLHIPGHGIAPAAEDWKSTLFWLANFIADKACTEVTAQKKD